LESTALRPRVSETLALKAWQLSGTPPVTRVHSLILSVSQPSLCPSLLLPIVLPVAALWDSSADFLSATATVAAAMMVATAASATSSATTFTVAIALLSLLVSSHCATSSAYSTNDQK
jgi:hypothetical protein